MNIVKNSQAFVRRINFLKSYVDLNSLWQKELIEVVADLENESADIQKTLNDLHRAQRLEKVFVTGLENNREFYKEYQNTPNTLWKDFVDNPASDDLQKQLADKMYKPDVIKTDKIIILVSHQYKRVLPHLLDRIISKENSFDIDYVDGNFDILLLNHCNDHQIERLANHDIAIQTKYNRRINLASNHDIDGTVPQDSEKKNLFQEKTKVIMDQRRKNGVHSVLTRIPSPTDAEIDEINHKNFTQVFFEMCDQPWDQIDKQQRLLIDELNKAKEIHFTNCDGTDISMDINGFTFVNSLIWRNVPGSEAFSAPRKDSAEGVIIAKGRYKPKDGYNKIIENITMEFKSGRLVRGFAEQENDHFQWLLNQEEGNRFIGELGIGTNPHLKRSVLNTLLVEKVSGSFHIALGNAFQMKEYHGEPVTIDNGNRSSLHWDITTMLYGKGGTIELDGRLLMREGFFVDENKYDVLNHGWEAIERSKRPDYWKDYYDLNPPTNKIRLGLSFD